ncbi:hypothetical protein GGR55DRAFT_678761 [Xylaria sp. FL0064]|nr:hypothetical protein GGR55DRAFT_678761 [Xylaria sp. FL0064]
MFSEFGVILLSFLAANAICSTFASRGTFNSSIIPTGRNSTPISYNISAGYISPAKGQKMVMLEFNDILLNAVQPFSGIFRGSALPNVSNITLVLPDHDDWFFDIETNYSTACSNATAIFSSTSVFMNCLQLGVTTVLLDNEVISLEEDSVRSANHDFHFGDLRFFNGSGVLDDITGCISSTCQNTSTSTCNWGVSSNLAEAYDPSYNVTEKLQRLFKAFSLYCDGAGAQPDSDVLGPWIVIASLTQCSAVAFLFLVSKVDRMTRRLKDWHRRDQEIDSLTHGPQFKSDLKLDRLRRAFSRLSIAAEAIVVDFQEAQIFFVLTIQIATFWFFNQNKVIESSKTYADANASYTLALTISYFGITPVFLGQTILQRSGRHWWYTTALTSITAILAWWSDWPSSDIDYAAIWTNLKATNPISQCGGNPSPYTYCGVYNDESIYGRDSFRPLVLSINKDLVAAAFDERLFVVFRFVTIWAPAFLFIDQLFTWIRGSQRWNWILQFCEKGFKWDNSRIISKMFTFLLRLIWITHQSLLVVSLVQLFLLLAFIFETYTRISGGWSHGQLVAALIWAPLGVKLLYYTICGVEKGVQNRIGEQFHVRGKDDTSSFATKPERVQPKEDMTLYISVADLSNDGRVSRDDWCQTTRKHNIPQSPMQHTSLTSLPYSPTPQEY